MKTSDLLTALCIAVSATTVDATFGFFRFPTKSNNPLGFATRTATAPSYGLFTASPLVNFFNFPYRPKTAVPTLSTTQDAKNTSSYSPNSAQHRGNWLPGYDINTNYETTWPNTGVVRQYTLRIQNTTLSPDGTPKPMLVINGQYPGPTITANWGDIIEATVINELQNNGTGIHWHGFRQVNTNVQDGVGGITECPIAPGQQKVYRFQATSYGTTWYHSHFSAQYGDGVVGAVVVNGPASANYDIDLGPVTISDYYPLTVFQEVWFADRFGPPQASNYLLNGKNAKPNGSGGQRFKFQFVPGKKHLIRLINTSVDALYKVKIDGHNFTVITNDFVAIQPYVTNELAIAIGQRYEIIVEANQAVGNYWFRAMAATACTNNANSGNGTANGIIAYYGAPNALPTTSFIPPNPACVDESPNNLVPVVPKSVDPSGFASTFSALPVGIRRVTLTGDDNVFLWYLGGVSQNIDWANPTIGQAVSGNTTYATEKHVVNLNSTNSKTWTFWVIQNQFFVPHPIHLHGHDFALLGQGNGTFNPATDTGLLNFNNPTRRDVAMLVASGWTVIAFQTDNPGTWLMHCHIAWHAGEGLSVQFLERQDQIPSVYGSYINSAEYKNNCAAWSKYASGNTAYLKSDSGLKK